MKKRENIDLVSTLASSPLVRSSPALDSLGRILHPWRIVEHAIAQRNRGLRVRGCVCGGDCGCGRVRTCVAALRSLRVVSTLASVGAASCAGAYTVEVVGNDEHLNQLQFRACDTDQPPAATFGRFVPEYRDLGLWAPDGAEALRVWQLRCPRGRPFACVAAEMTELARRKNSGCFEGVIKDLAELVVAPLALKTDAPGECREEVWKTFKYGMLPSLLRWPNLQEGSDIGADYARDASPALGAIPVKASMAELGALFDDSWPWTPHNQALSDMSILIRPDLLGIACVLEWRVSPLPFGASLAAVQSLLGNGSGDSWLYYPADPFELSRLLLYSVRRRLRDTDTVLDAAGRRTLLVAMRFGYAFDFGPKAASDPRRFRTSLLSQVMCAIEQLQWEEEQF
ncbi:hypothetical protein JX266_014140 [Neoarthrinium moseri]|nr:hypothetical protein JX266_014140 [Neoarthrinium moseri]